MYLLKARTALENYIKNEVELVRGDLRCAGIARLNNNPTLQRSCLRTAIFSAAGIIQAKKELAFLESAHGFVKATY